jgi:hypothetical protein
MTRRVDTRATLVAQARRHCSWPSAGKRLEVKHGESSVPQDGGLFFAELIVGVAPRLISLSLLRTLFHRRKRGHLGHAANVNLHLGDQMIAKTCRF